MDSFRFLFSRDLTIAHAFCRRFVWHRDCLWPQDLPPASLLVLAAQDDLVPSNLVLVRAYGLVEQGSGYRTCCLRRCWCWPRRATWCPPNMVLVRLGHLR